MDTYSGWTQEKKTNARRQFIGILKEMQIIIRALGLENDVEVNAYILGKAIIDYIEDLDRFEEFEGIKSSNIAKTYAYLIYWIARHKPIVILNVEKSEEAIYINEKVCTAILISNMQKEKNIALNTNNEYFVNLLFYNLKYRVYTQKSLELMIEGYFLGCDSSSQNAGGR